ncbi:50S ribosomal protein L27 [Candidatus Roizmanbacteria bacterium]|nr:50S ribosomal protein L27 [Candidatus Roizmanbacteria bacterium]
MAHTKSQKAASGNRDSRSKRLGVKIFGGQKVKPGYVIIRQKGTKFKPGGGVLLSKDYTLIALREGIVEFRRRNGKKYVFVV